MKIDITNFAGVKKASVNLNNKITLISGLNHSGKTSILRALGTVLLGRKMPEDQPQNQAGSLRHKGVYDAVIQLKEEGCEPTRWVYSERGVSVEEHSAMVSGWACGKRLTEMKPKERAAELIKLLKAEPSKQDWENACQDAFVLPDLSSKVWTEISTLGWETAERNQQQEGVFDKRRYQSLTGGDWGAKKGGAWYPGAWQSGDTVEQVGVFIQQTKSTRDELLKAQGMNSVRLQKLQELQSRPIAESFAQTNDALQLLLVELDVAEKRLAELRSKSAENVQGCPHCKKDLVVDSTGHIQKATTTAASKTGPEHTRAIASEAMRVQDLGKRKERLSRELAAFEHSLVEQEALEKELAAKGPTSKADEVLAIDAQIFQLQARQEAVQQVVYERSLDLALRQNEVVQKLLKPSGLRQASLEKALENFSADISAYTAWGAVRIRPDMSIQYEIETNEWRNLEDISASEWFRVDTLIQVAIANILNDRWILIDGAEILDQPSRGELFRFLAAVAPKSIVALTAKEPASVPDLAAMKIGQTLWMAEGAVQNVAVTA